MPVVPIEFISSDSAIRRFISENPRWQELNDIWEVAKGTEKTRAHAALSHHQDDLELQFGAAIHKQELQPIALKRVSGQWVQHLLPDEYWETSHSDVAIWTGMVDRLGLAPSDQWIAEAYLCFYRDQFEAWVLNTQNAASIGGNPEGRAPITPAKTTPSPLFPDANHRRPAGRKANQREQVSRWIAEKYTDGPPANITTDALVAELKEDGITVSPRTVSRAMGRK